MRHCFWTLNIRICSLSSWPLDYRYTHNTDMYAHPLWDQYYSPSLFKNHVISMCLTNHLFWDTRPNTIAKYLSIVRPLFIVLLKQSLGCVTSSGKTQLIQEKTVFSSSAIFYISIFIDFFYHIVQKARKVFSTDTHLIQNVQALISRRTEGAVSDRSLFVVSLHKPGFRRRRHICCWVSLNIEPTC